MSEEKKEVKALDMTFTVMDDKVVAVVCGDKAMDIKFAYNVLLSEYRNLWHEGEKRGEMDKVLPTMMALRLAGEIMARYHFQAAEPDLDKINAELADAAKQDRAERGEVEDVL